MRIRLTLVSLSLAFVVVACGGDDEQLPDSTASVIDAPNIDADTTLDADTTDADTTDAVPSRSEEFCNTYTTVCGFDTQNTNRYDDRAACLTAYEGYSANRLTCVDTHLGLAASDATTHCPHATGLAPCD